jgi:ATP-dependent Lon protease
VLDPEQNSTFMDHYLEVEYDLSDVMFVTTANTLNIPAPLMDRMEIIRIAGYTEDEKVEIARRHLLPKAIRDHAPQEGEFSITDEALREIIRTYTREAGVRNLERELMTLARKAVTEILRTDKKTVEVTPENLDDYLGVPRYPLRPDRTRGPGRCRHRACLDRGRRRTADHRRRHDARQGQDDRHRQPA